jgi:hypothetical protein
MSLFNNLLGKIDRSPRPNTPNRRTSDARSLAECGILEKSRPNDPSTPFQTKCEASALALHRAFRDPRRQNRRLRHNVPISTTVPEKTLLNLQFEIRNMQFSTPVFFEKTGFLRDPHQ